MFLLFLAEFPHRAFPLHVSMLTAIETLDVGHPGRREQSNPGPDPITDVAVDLAIFLHQTIENRRRSLFLLTLEDSDCDEVFFR